MVASDCSFLDLTDTCRVPTACPSLVDWHLTAVRLPDARGPVESPVGDRRLSRSTLETDGQDGGRGGHVCPRVGAVKKAQSPGKGAPGGGPRREGRALLERCEQEDGAGGLTTAGSELKPGC